MLQDIAERVDCPVCGAVGYQPCRVLNHREERERPDHKARLKLIAALKATQGE